MAELKAMCKENGLPVNGKKADLLERLNHYFSDDAEPEEEEMISLEDESISMEEEIVSLESESVPLPVIEDEEIMDAEVLEAEFVEEVEPAFAKEVQAIQNLGRSDKKSEGCSGFTYNFNRFCRLVLVCK